MSTNIVEKFAPEKISTLLKDLSIAEVKLGMKNSLNVFEAAGLARQETKHSRMLAFLLDPSKGHCLDAEVFKGLVLKNFESIITPPSTNPISPTRLILDGLGDLFIDCEWRNIDVLAFSKSLNLVVVIENKIDAKESDKNGVTQLQRYAEIIEKDPIFSCYSKLFLYLTIEGDEPSDKRWTTVTHEDILGFVDEPFQTAIQTGGMTPEANFFVKNYTDFLRRKIVLNPLLEEECRLIYQRHKELLDIIIDIVGSRDGVSEYADLFAEKTDSVVLANRSGKLAYLPNTLMLALPDGTLDKPWWGQQKPLIFWFYINEKRLKLILQVGPMKDKDVRKKLVDKIFEGLELERNRRTTDQYTVILSYSQQVDQESDGLMEKMIELNDKFSIHLPKLIQVINTFEFNNQVIF
jgi:hypothetical protein